jgi:hypothetical protein
MSLESESIGHRTEHVPGVTTTGVLNGVKDGRRWKVLLSAGAKEAALEAGAEAESRRERRCCCQVIADVAAVELVGRCRHIGVE